MGEESAPKQKRKQKPLAEEWILFYIWKSGGWGGNVSELSRRLGYSSDSYTNTKISDLKGEKCIERVKEEEGEFWKITRKGLWRIRAFALAYYGPLTLALFSLIPALWALEETFFHVNISPFDFFVATLVMLLFSLWLFRYTSRVIEGFLSRGRESLEDSGG